MSLRKLRGFPRTMEMAKKLNEYISLMLGKPYGTSPSKYLSKIKRNVSHFFNIFLYLLLIFYLVITKSIFTLAKFF